MNFQQLKYILAVEKFQNFNRAAIYCDVAQSTLSQEIQRLEKEYQIIIFDRTRHPVVPTMKGLDLLEKARELLRQKREFEEIAKQKKNKVSGNISLAITEILAPYLAPPLIAAVRENYPNLEIKLLELSDRRIEDLLIGEEIDAAIMISPSLSHDYFEHRLYEEEVMLYSHSALEEVERGSVVFDRIDFGSVMIHQDLQDILDRQIEGLVPENSTKSTGNIIYLKGNLETLKNIVEHNEGAMLIPKIALSFFTTDQQKRVYRFDGFQPQLKVSMIASRGFAKNRIIKHLIAEIKRIAEFEDKLKG